ncbi:LOW QUALITY PROTEIN: hypothetical protein N5P37_011520, partial [Trichoderma harzianum]
TKLTRLRYFFFYITASLPQLRYYGFSGTKGRYRSYALNKKNLEEHLQEISCSTTTYFFWAVHSNETELTVVPDATIAETTRATGRRPNDARSVDMAYLEETTNTSGNVTQTHILRRTRDRINRAAANRTFQIPELWNAAYDSLKEDADTAELVTSYVKALTTILGTKPDIVSGADISADLKDPTMRHIFMKKLVEEGLAKISTPSKITKGVGDVAQFIISAKGLIDAAIQNIPQAALPWAGICIGLQILLNPTKATKSNLSGIVYVISRMDWYCALTEHLLSEDCFNEPLKMILPQLETKVLALYKALLLYQMKSVCSYYRQQGLVFLRSLVSWDDWDNDLKTVEDAEITLQKDSDQYNKLHAKSALAQLVERAKSMEELLGDIHQTLRKFLTFQKELQLDEIDRKCCWDLRVVDPRDDMKKIENKKDALLPEAYEWPEIDVLSRLKSLTGDLRNISENLVELDAQRLARPVDAYIDHKLTALRGRDGYDASILAEISKEVRQRAMNTFLWVSLAFQHIKGVHGGYAVQDIKAMPPGLLELYDHMMTRIESGEKIKPQDCKKILMCTVLKQNMYDLDNGFTPENLEPPQRDRLASIWYSCLFWADHFVAGTSENPEGKSALADDGEVIGFLREKLLQWLEYLSVPERLSDGLYSIRKLLHVTQKSSQLARFLNDIEAFIQSHGSIIERAPLQIYASALVFSPMTSEGHAVEV